MVVARVWKRLIAYFIDMSFLSVCWWPVWLFLWQPMISLQEVSIPLNVVVVSVLLALFYKWMFLYFAGATPGKLIMGLRVVNRWDASQDLGLLQCLLRVVGDAFSLFFGIAPRALALFRFDRTHLSDWIAETQVVQMVEHQSIRRRWWGIALLVVYLSAPNSFLEAYRLIQNMSVEGGNLTISENFWIDLR